MAGRLDGKVCVITGAASGIGAETARLFAGEGARVVGVDISPGAQGDLALEVDVTDEEQVRDLYARAREELGRIDVLFNNAGINPTDDSSVLETSVDAWQRVQDTNLRSVFLCCKHGIPHLLDGDGGSVINTASFVAVMGAAVSQISYTASKGGVLALSRELGVEFARRGVRVNALCPGPVDTPMLRELYAADPEQGARRAGVQGEVEAVGVAQEQRAVLGPPRGAGVEAEPGLVEGTGAPLVAHHQAEVGQAHGHDRAPASSAPCPRSSSTWPSSSSTSATGPATSGGGGSGAPGGSRVPVRRSKARRYSTLGARSYSSR